MIVQSGRYNALTYLLAWKGTSEALSLSELAVVELAAFAVDWFSVLLWCRIQGDALAK